MNTNKSFKTATNNDIDLLINWGEKLHQVEKHFEPLLKWSKEESRNFYLKQLSNPEALFLMAYINEKPVGYLYAHVY